MNSENDDSSDESDIDNPDYISFSKRKINQSVFEQNCDENIGNVNEAFNIDYAKNGSIT